VDRHTSSSASWARQRNDKSTPTIVILCSTLSTAVHTHSAATQYTVHTDSTPTQYMQYTHQVHPLSSLTKKVKLSHTHYRALGPELIPMYRQSARRGLFKSSPGGWLILLSTRPAVTFQPNITILWLVPRYTAWWQRHIGCSQGCSSDGDGKTQDYDLNDRKSNALSPSHLHHHLLTSQLQYTDEADQSSVF